MKKIYLSNSQKSKWLVFFLLISVPFLSYSQEKQEPLFIKPDKEAYVLRCFSKFNDKKLSHAIAVGDPTKVHYIINANNGALLKVWKGEFIDVAPIWIDRGGNLLEAPSSAKSISNLPTFAVLPNKDQVWPDSIKDANGYKFKGYKLDKAGRPTFKYNVFNINFDDILIPSENGITREIHLNGNPQPTLYCLLAEGSDIKKTSKNTYQITDKGYSVTIEEVGKNKPIIREINGKKELIVMIGDQKNLKYSIIW